MEKFKEVQEYQFPDLDCTGTLGEFYDCLKDLVSKYGRGAECYAILESFEVITTRMETAEEQGTGLKKERAVAKNHLEYLKRQVKEYSDKLGIVTEE